MCIRVYTDIHVCICICIYVYVYKCIYAYNCIYIYMSLCLHLLCIMHIRKENEPKPKVEGSPATLGKCGQGYVGVTKKWFRGSVVPLKNYGPPSWEP